MNEFAEQSEAVAAIESDEEQREIPATTPAEVVAQLRRLQHDWSDHPELSPLTPAEHEDLDTPERRAAFEVKTHNKRRLAWFDSVGGWAVWAGHTMIPGEVGRNLEQRGNALIDTTRAQRQQRILMTDDDVRTGDQLLADTIIALEKLEGRSS